MKEKVVLVLQVWVPFGRKSRRPRPQDAKNKQRKKFECRWYKNDRRIQRMNSKMRVSVNAASYFFALRVGSEAEARWRPELDQNGRRRSGRPRKRR